MATDVGRPRWIRGSMEVVQRLYAGFAGRPPKRELAYNPRPCLIARPVARLLARLFISPIASPIPPRLFACAKTPGGRRTGNGGGLILPRGSGGPFAKTIPRTATPGITSRT